MQDQLVVIAPQQEGLLSTEQIRSIDLTEWRRRQLVASGWLRPVAPRVYSIRGVPETHRYRLRIGSPEPRRTKLGELRGRRDAARTRPVEAGRSGVHDRSEPTQLSDCRSASIRPPGSSRSTWWTWRDSDRCRRPGRSSTSLTPALTRRASKQQSTAPFASGSRHPRSSRTRLATLRGSGRWGCRLIEDLVVDAGGHTMLERRFLQLVREAGLPRPRTQVVHRKNGRHVARVDFLFDEADIVVEVSGPRDIRVRGSGPVTRSAETNCRTSAERSTNTRGKT